MNFLGVGAQEIILVALIAAVVVGPQRFPELAVQVAKALKFLRNYANSATSQMRGELDELTKEYAEVRKELRELKQTTQKEVEIVAEQLSQEAADATGTLDQEVAAAKASVGQEVTAVKDSMRSATSGSHPSVTPSGERPPRPEARSRPVRGRLRCEQRHRTAVPDSRRRAAGLAG